MDTLDITDIYCNIENAEDIYNCTNFSMVNDFIIPVCTDIDMYKPIDIGNNINIYLNTATFFSDKQFGLGTLGIFIQVKSDYREGAINLLDRNERAKQLVIQRLYELVDALNTSQLNINVPIDHLDNCRYIDSANAFFNKIGEPTPTMMKPRFTYDEYEADRLFEYPL